MKRILSLLAVLVFVAGCGGGSGSDTGSESMMPKPETSVDFEEIEIPAFIPDEIVSLVTSALTNETSRRELVRTIREAHFCNLLDDWTDEQIWNEMVYQFSLDDLEDFGNTLDEAIRNALDNDLDYGIYYELYGPTLDTGEIWAIIADEVDDEYENDPGECS